MLLSMHAVRGHLLPLFLAVVLVSKFSQQFILSVQNPTFILKLLSKSFRSVTFNLIIVAETHVYMKASSATRQRGARALGAHRIK